jgi:hypothetical protein
MPSVIAFYVSPEVPLMVKKRFDGLLSIAIAYGEIRVEDYMPEGLAAGNNIIAEKKGLHNEWRPLSQAFSKR